MNMDNSPKIKKADILKDLEENLGTEYRAMDLCNFLQSLIRSAGDKKLIKGIAQDELKHTRVVRTLITDIEENYPD